MRTDDNWESWNMEAFIDGLKKWLKRDNREERPGNSYKPTFRPSRDHNKDDKHWFIKDGTGKDQVDSQRNKGTPVYMYCEMDHLGDTCTTVSTLESRRKLFSDNRLCYNCGRSGHPVVRCQSHGCYKCNGKHHTSICDTGNSMVLSIFTPVTEELALPAITPVKVQGSTFWVYVDTGSGRNFISSEAANQLKLTPTHHETRQMVTLNGTKRQSMPIFHIAMDSLDGKRERRSKLPEARCRNSRL